MSNLFFLLWALVSSSIPQIKTLCYLKSRDRIGVMYHGQDMLVLTVEWNNPVIQSKYEATNWKGNKKN